MSKDDFKELMRNKANEMKELKDEKVVEVRSSTRKNTKKLTGKESDRKIIMKNLDIFPYEEDEEDQKINEEFKGVLRSVKIL
jgi:hypothetical protein